MMFTIGMALFISGLVVFVGGFVFAIWKGEAAMSKDWKAVVAVIVLSGLVAAVGFALLLVHSSPPAA